MNNPASHPRVPHGTAMYLTIARRNVLDWLEVHDGLPPAMFATRESLLEWARDHEIDWESIRAIDLRDGEIDPDSALLLRKEGLSPPTYQAVWVRVDFDAYRAALKAHIVNLFAATGDYRGVPLPDDRIAANRAETAGSMKTIDADHVINRARLRANHPGAWVMLLPIPSSSNRGFGSRVEKGSPQIPPGCSRVDIDHLLLLKIFGVLAPPRDLISYENFERMLDGSITDDVPGKRDLIDQIRKIASARWPDLLGP